MSVGGSNLTSAMNSVTFDLPLFSQPSHHLQYGDNNFVLSCRVLRILEIMYMK